MRRVESRAPGRVNLIGEHTDYNGGFVMPCAIGYETRVTARERADRRVRVRSQIAGEAEFDLDAPAPERRGDWGDYPRGIVLELLRAGIPLRGADLDVDGNVPPGAGLSSSASLEIAIALALLELSQTQMPRLRVAQLAQRAEIRHVGTRCGIMDQFAALFGRRGHALVLDTRSLQYEALPVPGGAAIVICNTMVKHELAAGAYNERREECERAVALLKRRYPEIDELRDVTPAQLDEARYLLPEPLFDRALHVVDENHRVAQAAQALRHADLRRFGELMNASHESLRRLYKVSCSELDIMVECARDLPGVYGARMTGGGFGGCTVNLVDAARAAEFRSAVAQAYRERTGIVPEMYDGTPAPGASVIHE